MITKKNLIYAIAAGLIGLASCKKEENSILPPVELPRQLTKMTYSGMPIAPVTFKYDGKGRLTEAANAYVKYSYSYTNNVFAATFSDQNNYMYGELKNGKLDNNGRLLEADGIYHQPNQPDTYYKYVFNYDANGYITWMTQTNTITNSVSRDDYTYSNGNMISDVNTANGQPNYHLEYTYYDSLPNKNTIDFQEGIVNFYTDGLTGKRSQNLRKTQQNFNAQNVKNIDNLFTYEMDVQGYPVKYKMKNLLQNFDSERVFEYNK